MNFLQHHETYSLPGVSDHNYDHLQIAEINEFLPQIHKWTTISVGVITTIFIVAVGSTNLLTYKATVKVPANIRPVGELKLVESPISGQVQKILVKTNQLINQGEAIAYLDNSSLQTRKKQLENIIQKSELQLLQVDAQIREINHQISAQTNLNNRIIVAAQAEFIGTQRNFDDQIIRANAEMLQAQIELKYARLQLERLQKEKLLSATIEEAQAALNLARLQRDRLKSIVNSGAISQSLLEEKEQAVKSAQTRLEQAKNNSKTLWEEKQQALKIAQTNLEKAKTGVNPLNSSVIMAAERIKQEQARGEANLAALKKELRNLLQQRLEIQKQLTQSEQDLQQTTTDLNKSIIRAPITGTLLQLKLRNSGQVVQPSEPIAHIAPLNAPLQIKAYIPAQDINKIETNQKVQMRVSACPYPDYGTLKGTVKNVAPDALPINNNSIKTNSDSSQILGYEITIEPEKLYLGKGTILCHLQPGMEGLADIISRQETVMQFILRKARLITDL